LAMGVRTGSWEAKCESRGTGERPRDGIICNRRRLSPMGRNNLTFEADPQASRHPLSRGSTEVGAWRGWRGWQEAASVVLWPPHLRQTVATALIVGTILFAINQLNLVIDGHADTWLWIKTGVTYLVPFTVSNVGVLIGTRHR
jgi:hypothetical protein